MRKYFIAGLMLFCIGAFAQQDAQFSQYMFNGLILNPAYAGNKGLVNVNGIYRNQWTGIDGAPRTMTLTCDGPVLNKKVGLGLDIINDKLGAQGIFSMFTSYSYRLKVGDNSTLSMGIAAGFSQYTLDGSKITFYDGADNARQNIKSSDIIPDAKFGLYYSSDNFYAGASASNLFAQKINLDLNSGEEVFLTQGRHYFVTSGYIFPRGTYFKFYPSFLIKEDFKAPTNIDLNAFFLYNDLIWVGTSYRSSMKVFRKDNLSSSLRTSDVVALMLEVYLNDKIRVGYAYDITTSELKAYNSGSHEISLSYNFPQRKRAKMLTPRYF